VLSMIFLDEHPAPYHFVGIVLIFTGIWINTRKPT
jgi:drug/metabolite transporter (DMT)-like permease